MKLTDFNETDLQIIQDGSFSSLGLCGAAAGVPILTFAGNIKYLKTALANPDVSCVLVPAEQLESEALQQTEKGIASAEDIRTLFFKLHNQLAAVEKDNTYVRKSTPSQFGRNFCPQHFCEISPNNVVIGDNVTIESFVKIHENVQIGDGCIIRSGTVLGGTGLEFIRMGSQGILAVTHCGGLRIGSDVEIQYNCNVSRSLFPWDDTVIGAETKIESLVHVAHGVKLGKRALVAASACIGGSAEIGDDVWIGPNATLSSEVKVSDRARISLGAVVVGNVAAGETVSGNFALSHEKFMQDQMRKML
jgi:UDP-3-O-[3-hydroxymyristoyl] glucosamine N-acyltransferase